MELGEAEAVGVLDDEGVDIRNVDARFDDGRAHEHLDFSVRELLHHGGQTLFVHLAVRDADRDLFAEKLFELSCAAVDGLHAVVHVVDLPAAGKLAPDGVGDDAPVMLEDVGLHRLAVDGRDLDGGHVANARERHVERAGNGRCRERQRVDLAGKLLELFLVRHAEALLLVDDEEPQVLEVQALLQQRMRADQKIDLARGRVLHDLLFLRRRFEAREHLDAHGKRAEAVDRRCVVLLGEHRGRH